MTTEVVLTELLKVIDLSFFGIMNKFSLLVLFCGILLSIYVKSSPLFITTSDHCKHGFCPVRPTKSKENPKVLTCPQRYRLNIDICVPTRTLCEDAQKHGLYCTTSTKKKSYHVGWFQKRS